MSNSLSLYMSASCTLISSKLQKVETFCFVVGTSSDRVVMEFLLRFKMIETQRGHRLSQTQYNCSSKKEFLLMSMVLFVAVHNHYKRIYKPIRRLGARPRRCRRRRVLRRARASTRCSPTLSDPQFGCSMVDWVDQLGLPPRKRGWWE